MNVSIPGPEKLGELYEDRFSEANRKSRNRLWKVLCKHFFQGYVPTNAHVLDMGAGYGEFINHIQAAEKTAVDLNPGSATHLSPETRFLNQSAEHLEGVASESVDVVFASNFFEHLPDREALANVVREAHRILKTEGRLIVLQPNIRYVGGAYWDFIDHHIPLTHLSCAELMVNCGFRIEKMIPRFLPYTTKSNIPQSAALVRLYLAFPPIWRLMGKQSLIIGRRTSDLSQGR